MTHEQRERITKQDIMDYIHNMQIKKYGLGGGGLDKVDVYFHIQQIVTMYDAYLKNEIKNQKGKEETSEEVNKQLENLNHFKQLASSLQEENDAQKRTIEVQAKELEAAKALALTGTGASTLTVGTGFEGSQAELTVALEKISALEAELSKYKSGLQTSDGGSVGATIEELRAASEEILHLHEELKVCTQEAEELKNRLAMYELGGDLIPGDASAMRLSNAPQNYTDDIGEILRESRAEGQRIIDEARRESEKELVKMLNLRAKYKHENEMYRNWCSRVAGEKKAIEEFLSKLSVQYQAVSRTLTTVKEDAEAFNIERIFSIADISKQEKGKPPGAITEADYSTDTNYSADTDYGAETEYLS